MSSKYSYFFTPLAEQDIDSVLQYISENLCNVKAAVDLYGKLESTIENICLFPYSSADCSCFLISDENIRHIPINNYCLIYEIKEEQKQINILRFRYAPMDLTKLTLK